MIKKLLFFIISIFFLNNFSQSIAVNPNGNPASTMSLSQLISNVLISSTCASASNFQQNVYNSGTNRSYGYFNYSGTNFPFSEGIILSTGHVNDALGPMILQLQVY